MTNETSLHTIESTSSPNNYCDSESVSLLVKKSSSAYKLSANRITSGQTIRRSSASTSRMICESSSKSTSKQLRRFESLVKMEPDSNTDGIAAINQNVSSNSLVVGLKSEIASSCIISSTNSTTTTNNNTGTNVNGAGSGNGKTKLQKKSQKPRRRVATVAQRRAANIRERRRMFNLNAAFDRLRKKVPSFAYEKRLSRIETLKLAIMYIKFMDDLVHDDAYAEKYKQLTAQTSTSIISTTSSHHHHHHQTSSGAYLSLYGSLNNHTLPMTTTTTTSTPISTSSSAYAGQVPIGQQSHGTLINDSPRLKSTKSNNNTSEQHIDKVISSPGRPPRVNRSLNGHHNQQRQQQHHQQHISASYRPQRQEAKSTGSSPSVVAICCPSPAPSSSSTIVTNHSASSTSSNQAMGEQSFSSSASCSSASPQILSSGGGGGGQLQSTSTVCVASSSDHMNGSPILTNQSQVSSSRHFGSSVRPNGANLYAQEPPSSSSYQYYQTFESNTTSTTTTPPSYKAMCSVYQHDQTTCYNGNIAENNDCRSLLDHSSRYGGQMIEQMGAKQQGFTTDGHLQQPNHQHHHLHSQHLAESVYNPPIGYSLHSLQAR